MYKLKNRISDPQNELEYYQAHDALWDEVGNLVRATSVGTMTYEEAYQELKRCQRKSDELRHKKKQETQQRMFDLALSTFERKKHDEKR